MTETVESLELAHTVAALVLRHLGGPAAAGEDRPDAGQLRLHERLRIELRPHPGAAAALAELESDPGPAGYAGLVQGLVQAVRDDPALAVTLAILARGALTPAGVAGLRAEEPGLRLVTAEDVGVVAPGGTIDLTGTNVAGRDLLIAHQHLHVAGITQTGPFHLPPDVGDFTGRTGDVEQLCRALGSAQDGRSPALVVSTVAGKAGVGKTALAVHVAHRLKPQFPDGQLFVDLRGVEAERLEPRTVLAGMLRALGVNGSAVPATLEGRIEEYRARLEGRRVLVVLDNAGDEAQVRPLLPGSATCAALVTSRVSLAGLPGAEVVHLEVLTPGLALELLTRVVGPARVAAEPEAAERLVALCGFLPLAVRIVGARLLARRHWRLERMGDRLADERTRLSELRFRDLEVRASLGLSYAVLGGRQQQAFRRLGVLRAQSFPAWAAEAVVDPRDEPHDELADELVETELLEVAGTDPVGQDRFRFHDLIRVYARELVAAQDDERDVTAALARVLTVYLALAGRADRALRAAQGAAGDEPGPDDLPVPREPAAVVLRDPAGWLDAERANLVIAIEQAHQVGLWRLAWRLTEALAGFLEERAFWGTSQYCHELALDAARQAGDRRAEARTLRSLGTVHRDQDHWAQAESCLVQSREIFAAAGDEDEEMRTVSDLGEIFWYRSRWDEALACFDRCLPFFRARGDRREEAMALVPLARVHRDSGAFDLATRCFEQAVEAFGRLGDRLQESIALVGLAMTQRDRGQVVPAIDHARRAQELARSVSNDAWEAIALTVMGDGYREQHWLDEAAACFERAVPTFRRLNDPWFAFRSLRGLGQVRLAQGRTEDALSLFTEALPGYRDLGDRRGEGGVLCDQATANLALGRRETAAEQVAEARSRFVELGDRPGQVTALTVLGRIRGADGAPEEARAHWLAALAIADELDLPAAATLRTLLG